ncbi:putative endo-polygalacturonase [Dioscorea sansibarensis]
MVVIKLLSITLLFFFFFSQSVPINLDEGCRGKYEEKAKISGEVLVVNVDEFGANGDGKDDTKAFEKAWEMVCKSLIKAVLVVPDKNYLVKPIVFSGPCLSSIQVEIKGTIEAPSHASDWNGKNIRHWIVFDGVKDLIVKGGGTIDGNGENWWKNSCKVNKTLAMTFYSCDDLRLQNLKFKNSQKIHLSFEDCQKVQASHLNINAPETSPNTDGIHITRTTYMDLTNSEIKTGDDCVSIVTGSRNIRISNIICGPGHGISIGSLGANNSEGHVANVMVNNAKITDTSNGVRIKTWQGGHGYVKNILFKNIAMHNVQNPIIIDQNYCDSDTPCQKQVRIRFLFYFLKNIPFEAPYLLALDPLCIGKN